MPSNARSSRPTRAMRSASSNCRASGSPIRPTDARSTVSPPVSSGHFCDERVTALVASRSPAPTSRPLPSGGVTPAKAKVTIAMLALSIAASSPAADAATGCSSRAALAAGTAMTTASAASCSATGTAPHSSVNPVARAGDAADGHAGAHGESPAVRDGGRQPAKTAAQRGEHRPGRRGAGADVGDRGGGFEQRSAGFELGGQSSHRGPQRERVGPSGVDAAEQRLDQAVGHLVAQSGRAPAHRPRRPRSAAATARVTARRPGRPARPGSGPQTRAPPRRRTGYRTSSGPAADGCCPPCAPGPTWSAGADPVAVQPEGRQQVAALPGGRSAAPRHRRPPSRRRPGRAATCRRPWATPRAG